MKTEELATSSTRELHFRDQQGPHEVQSLFERELMTLFTPTLEGDRLCLRAQAVIVGATYEFWLRFEAVLPTTNCYSLAMRVSWEEQASSHGDYYRRTSRSWFELWTREFTAANPPLAHEGSSQRYQQRCEEAMQAEQHLDSIDAIQHAIIAAMKRGASFRSVHKEGGTNIFWKGDRFIRSDYGDYPDELQFTDDNPFLTMLRQFCNMDVTRNSGTHPLSEMDAWRLIMRRMVLP